MKIFPTNIIKKLDELTIESEGIHSIDLMERAAEALTEAIVSRWDNDRPVVVFAGPGNNGGDALAVARMLSERGYQIEVYLFNTKGALSEDCAINKDFIEGLPNIKFNEVTNQFTPPLLTIDHLVIDGLFGSGLNKALSGGFAAVVKNINASSATVVSIAVALGLLGQENKFNIRATLVRADVILCLQIHTLSFLFA